MFVKMQLDNFSSWQQFLGAVFNSQLPIAETLMAEKALPQERNENTTAPSDTYHMLPQSVHHLGADARIFEIIHVPRCEPPGCSTLEQVLILAGNGRNQSLEAFWYVTWRAPSQSWTVSYSCCPKPRLDAARSPLQVSCRPKH